MKVLVITTLILASLLAATAAEATTIQYELTSPNRYEWTVFNDPVGADITDFLIYFSDPYTQEATGLAVDADVPDWNEVIWPASGGPTPLPGMYEATADLGYGIAPGTSLGGFAATFTWTGGAAGPGSQYFEIYDEDWNLLGSGYTVPMGGGQIPEWGSLALFFVGMGPIGLIIRRRR